MRKKKGYGVFNPEVKVKYAIIILDGDEPTKGKYITDIDEKSYLAEDGEKAFFFDDYEVAAEKATLINLRTTTAFVITVPELMPEENGITYFDRFINK